MRGGRAVVGVLALHRRVCRRPPRGRAHCLPAPGVALVAALLLSALLWNVGMWYYSISVSSSHALLGSLLKMGTAVSHLLESPGAVLNWNAASKTGIALLMGPLLGFAGTLGLMRVLKRVVRQKALF